MPLNPITFTESVVRDFMRNQHTTNPPPPVFETDEYRTAFVVRLPCRPRADARDAVAPTPQVTPQVLRLLHACEGELLREELQQRLGLADRKHFHKSYLRPALDAGMVEMTLPDKPQSSRQRYRLTSLGRARLHRS